MYFPVAGIEVSPFVPPLVALAVSCLTSMGGLSGAFLLLPFQMSVLGFTSPAVSPTNLLYNIVAIPSGVYRYIREGRMNWGLAGVTALGSLPGVGLGAWIRVVYLPEPRAFKFFVGLVLVYMGWRMAWGVIDRPVRGHVEAKPPAMDARVRMLSLGFWRMSYEFDGQEYGFNPPAIFALSLAVGVVGGIYGIGGGALIAPVLISVLGLPVYTTAGATLAGTFLTSIFGVVFYAALAPHFAAEGLAVLPDWRLGLAFGFGGLAGMYLGARTQRFMPPWLIKALLAVLLFVLGARYIAGFFLVS